MKKKLLKKIRHGWGGVNLPSPCAIGLNRFHSQKRFCSTFPCHTSRNHSLFGLFVSVMKKPITWNFIFFIHTIDTIVLNIEGNIHRKIVFVLPYASFDWSFSRKFFRQGSGSFRLPLLCSRTHSWCFYPFELLEASSFYHSSHWRSTYTSDFFNFSWWQVGTRVSPLVKKPNLLQVLHFLPSIHGAVSFKSLQ